MNPDELLIAGLAQTCEQLLAIVASASEFQFYQDDMMPSAVIYKILVTGEAANRLSKEFRQRNPNIPWRDMIDMRNHLIHAFDDIDFVEVWNTATFDIPDLLGQLREIRF